MIKHPNQIIEVLKSNKEDLAAFFIDNKHIGYSLPVKQLLNFVQKAIENPCAVGFQNFAGIPAGGFLEL